MIAHRGFSGVYPENTLLGLRAALEAGCDGVELDVLLSRDGELMVLHPDAIPRVTGQDGPIGAFTRAELQAIDIGAAFDPRYAGERMATLAQAIELCRGYRAVMCIELKDLQDGDVQGYEDRIIDLFRRQSLFAKAVINVGPADFARRVKTREPRICVCIDAPHERWARLDIMAVVDELMALPADMVEYEHNHITPESVTEFRRHGMPIWAWTANQRADLERLVEFGVDGILTDQPERLHELLDLPGAGPADDA